MKSDIIQLAVKFCVKCKENFQASPQNFEQYGFTKSLTSRPVRAEQVGQGESPHRAGPRPFQGRLAVVLRPGGGYEALVEEPPVRSEAVNAIAVRLSRTQEALLCFMAPNS